MKAVISNRIYMEADYFLQRDLEKELTYSIPARNIHDPPIVIKTINKVKDNLVSIPSGRVDLIPSNYEIVDKRVLKEVEFPEFKYELRPSQKEVYDSINDNAIINASVSWGKTFCGIAIATKLKQKTLVVVHNVGLRDQWVKEVQKTLGITPGIIGSGQFNNSTPIVIGNTQTLYKNVPLISKDYGLILVDEMHHTPSNTFSKIIDSNYARYKIGLSGTILRKDGKHVVFQDYFGHDVYKPPKENYMKPNVHIMKSKIRLSTDSRTPWAIRMNELSRNPEYREFIAILAGVYATKGHKVLVVSDRTSLLKACAELIGPSATYITGPDENNERNKLDEVIKEKDIIFGTQSIFSEGISVNALSCLILATPINNEPLLTQLIGRIVRVHPNKLTPVVVDINLLGGIAQHQAKARLAHYVQEGYNVRFF